MRVINGNINKDLFANSTRSYRLTYRNYYFVGGFEIAFNKIRLNLLI